MRAAAECPVRRRQSARYAASERPGTPRLSARCTRSAAHGPDPFGYGRHVHKHPVLPDTWQIRCLRHADDVATKERPIDRGTRTGRRIVMTSGAELRMARIGLGLSLQDVGRAVGLSYSQVGRIERAAHPSVSVIQLARIGGVLGLDLSVRTYPNGSPLRDSAHVALLRRFRDRALGRTVHPVRRCRFQSREICAPGTWSFLERANRSASRPRLDSRTSRPSSGGSR